MFIGKETKQFVVKSYEEELGSELFIVNVPASVPEKDVYDAFDVAAKYAYYFDYDLDEEEGIAKYDKHYMKMAEAVDCGIANFQYYLEEICGWEVKSLEYDYEFEW